MTVSVTLDAQHKLNAAITSVKDQKGENVGANDMVFTNTYTPDPAELVLKATKILEGRDLKAGEFSFVRTGPDDVEKPPKTMPTAM